MEKAGCRFTAWRLSPWISGALGSGNTASGWKHRRVWRAESRKPREEWSRDSCKFKVSPRTPRLQDRVWRLSSSGIAALDPVCPLRERSYPACWAEWNLLCDSDLHADRRAVSRQGKQNSILSPPLVRTWRPRIVCPAFCLLPSGFH